MHQLTRSSDELRQIQEALRRFGLTIAPASQQATDPSSIYEDEAAVEAAVDAAVEAAAEAAAFFSYDDDDLYVDDDDDNNPDGTSCFGFLRLAMLTFLSFPISFSSPAN